MSVTLDLSRVSTPVTPAPVTLSGMTRTALREALIAADICPPEKAKMRATQVWRWIHFYGVTDFAAMTDIGKNMRARLAAAFTVARPEIVERQVSKDGTRKWLIRTAPGIEVEAVYIPDVGRAGALCVSSQVGCTLNCTFCHTGTQKLVRNLTAAEIVAQVQVCRDDLEEWPKFGEDVTDQDERRLSNIVFMGMISLHATNDALRDVLVPLNRKYNLEALMAGIRAYPGLSNARRVTFEYVMLKGINDSPDEARALIKLIEGIPAKINLIPFNPWPGTDYECSDWKTIERFAAIINKAGYASPIRTPRGRDILAACGQLKSESEKVRASALRKAAPTAVAAA